MAKTANRDSRQSGRRVVEGRPGQATGASRARNTTPAREREPREGESVPADEVRQERAERTRKAVEAANEGAREDPAVTRRRLTPEVAPELSDIETGDYPENSSTPSQQPTMLETKGGTEQPHPTMAPRAARSGRGLEPPPGRSHDNSLHTAGPKGEGTLRVRATRTGYYNHIRRREGDVFTLVGREGMLMQPVMAKAKDGEEPEQRLHPRTGEPMFKNVKGTLTAEEQFSENWMEIVSDDEVERTSTSKDAIRKRHDEILGGQSRTVDKDVTGAGDE